MQSADPVELRPSYINIFVTFLGWSRLEYAKYILNAMITDHFHVTVNQGLLTRFLPRSGQDTLY